MDDEIISTADFPLAGKMVGAYDDYHNVNKCCAEKEVVLPDGREVRFACNPNHEDEFLLACMKRILHENGFIDADGCVYDKSCGLKFFWAPCYSLLNAGDTDRFTLLDYKITNLGRYDSKNTDIILYSDRISDYAEKRKVDENYIRSIVFAYHYGLFLTHKLPIDGEAPDYSDFPDDWVNGPHTNFALFLTHCAVRETKYKTNKYTNHLKILLETDNRRNLFNTLNYKYVRPIISSIKNFRYNKWSEYR